MRAHLVAATVLAFLATGATAACDERTSSTSVTIVQTKPASAPAGSAATVDERCARGEQHACGELLGDETRSHAAIADAITKLCDHGSLAACNSLGAAKVDGEIMPKDAAGAVALWEKSCAAKNAAGCNNVGVAHREGLVSGRDPVKALASFQQACELSDAVGCANAGRLLGDGADGVPQDVPAATKLLARGCAGDSDDACDMLANAAKLLVAPDKPAPANLQLAITAYEQLCDRDDGASCSEAGWTLETRVAAKDDAAIVKLYERGCKLDDNAGCYHHARLTHDAAGFERACQLHDKRACLEAMKPWLASKTPAKAYPFLEEACRLDDKQSCKTGCKLGDPLSCEYADDRKRAVALRTQGCDANDSKSCFDLGYAYHHGEGVKLDHARGAELEEKACKLGGLDACFDLAERKEKALDRAADLPGAAADYDDLCKRGDGDACDALAFLHTEGRGVAKDPAAASALYLRGCDLGTASSCYFYAQPLIDKDRDVAIAKLKLACRLGDKRGCDQLHEHGITARMDPARHTVFNNVR